MTIEEIQARQAEIRSELADIDKEFAGEALPDDVRSRWNDLDGELQANDELIAELETRRQRLEAVADNDANREDEERFTRNTPGRRQSRVPEDIYDVAAYRARSSTDEEYRQSLRDGAMKAVETMHFAHPDASREEQQSHIGTLLDTIDHDGTLARRILTAGSPIYFRAFGKALAGKSLNAEEQRALGIGSQGGNYPVPVTLDPTVLRTSNGAVNPLRQVSRVFTITGNTWNGVASAGVTAAYSAEAAENTDDSPTLTQLSANVEKADAFVPISIENSEDWSGFTTELAQMFQDAKDELESSKFLTGLGHSSTEPQGLLVGATAVVLTATTAVFAIGDLYNVVQALAERWQPNASILANRAALNKVRQFDSSGGASLWVQLQAGYPQRLLDYPTYVYSSMSSAVTTSGSSILTVGDFSKGFYIIDRVGMEVEIIQHLFATANNRPSGQRGVYAYWRNTSLVTTQLAFKTVKIL